MSAVEDRLAELLRSAAPPSAGVPFEQVHRRVRRRRTARWSVAASALAAAAVVAVVAVVAFRSPAAPTHRSDEAAATPSVDLSGAVPWVDDPVLPYQEPPAAAPTASGRPAGPARPCTAHDVAVRVDGQNGATGHLAHYLVFRNSGTSTCVLSGYPHVVGIEPGHQPVTATAGSFFDHGTTASMAPGQETGLTVETDSACAAHPAGASGPAYHRLAITLPAGGTVSVDDPDGLDVVCGLHVSHFVVDPPADPAPAHDPLSDLTVALEVPPTVRAGATLVYVAELTNPTDLGVPLDRCPGYVESSTGGSVLVKDSHQLDCAPVGTIAARATVRFEMRLPIPAEVAAGPLTVHWSLAAPFQVTGAATVQVEPAAGRPGA